MSITAEGRLLIDSTRSSVTENAVCSCKPSCAAHARLANDPPDHCDQRPSVLELAPGTRSPLSHRYAPLQSNHSLLLGLSLLIIIVLLLGRLTPVPDPLPIPHRMSSPAYLLPMPQGTKIPSALEQALHNVERQFDISTQKLDEITKQMLWEYGKGLSELPTDETRDTFVYVRPNSPLSPPSPRLFLFLHFFSPRSDPILTVCGHDSPMIPSYLQHIPGGSEKGTYLALDLGGTNLRVCEVELLGDSKWRMKQQKYKVSDALKVGEVTALFDYIAGSVDHFLTEIGTTATEDEKLHLGFTFSFPVLQTALAAGTLINWTKVGYPLFWGAGCRNGGFLLTSEQTPQGFECKNAVGKDVVQLLQDALDRKHIHVRCSALVNDTCGTLMAAAYERGDCLCGGIFGTGTNGAYVESIEKLTKMGYQADELEQNRKNGLDKMVVNTEWGAFDNERITLPFTIFDSRVDRISINPRKQAFEKVRRHSRLLLRSKAHADRSSVTR